MERLEMDFKNIDNTSEDIYLEFSFMKLENVFEALRNGSLGKYGKTFKLTTQEVCVWIRQYLNDKNKNRML